MHFSSAPGGIEILIPKIINEFSDTSFNVFVIRPPLSGFKNVYGNQQYIVKYGSSKNLVALYLLWRYGVSHRNDIFHVFNIGPFALFALRISGIKKLVYSIRGTVYWRTKMQRFIRMPFWKFSISKHYKFIANSEHSKICFLEAVKCNLNDVQVLYNPVYSAGFGYNTIINEVKNSIFKISYVGRLAKSKNLFYWLMVVSLLEKKIPNIDLSLYGDGPLQNELKLYSKKLGIEEKVHFKGFLDDIYKAYGETNILLFLSERESFGNVVVESILCGTPVIVFSIPSMKEIFINYPEFLINKDDHIENVLEDIIKKINNFSRLKILTLEAAKEFKIRFSMKQHIEKLRAIYNATYTSY